MTESGATAGRGRSSQVRAAYQGIRGAYGEDAVHRYWGGRARAVGAPTFSDALGQVLAGAVEWAVIPIWNTTTGAIRPGHTALAAHGTALEVVDELDVPVHHCLVARAGTSLSDIRFVGSHPAALGQCRRFFRARPEIVPCSVFDTAGAARDLLAGHRHATTTGTVPWWSPLRVGPEQCAAIASASAARQYRLSILTNDLQDDPANVTRFAIVRTATERRWREHTLAGL